MILLATLSGGIVWVPGAHGQVRCDASIALLPDQGQFPPSDVLERDETVTVAVGIFNKTTLDGVPIVATVRNTTVIVLSSASPSVFGASELDGLAFDSCTPDPGIASCATDPMNPNHVLITYVGNSKQLEAASETPLVTLNLHVRPGQMIVNPRSGLFFMAADTGADSIFNGICMGFAQGAAPFFYPGRCGDGFADPELGEECDDDNDVLYDGCGIPGGGLNNCSICPEGSPCPDTDDNTCTEAGCAAGFCQQHRLVLGGSPCRNPDNECEAGTCNSEAVCAQLSTLPEGTSCTDNDGDPCTAASCVGGLCDQSPVATGQCLLTDCAIGYPFPSADPRSNVAFKANQVLRSFRPQGLITASPGQTIKAWYNGKNALVLGVRQVVVKTKTSTTTTDYPISPLCATPATGCSALDPEVGATQLDGEQAGTDTAACAGFPDLCDRPVFPALFITDVTNDPDSRAGDWQSGGTPIAPHAVFGTWKGAVKTVTKTSARTRIKVKPDRNPSDGKNHWNLGAGDSVPAPTPPDKGFGAELRWNVDDLVAAGHMTLGHSYRLQFLVHDGARNSTGGNAGENCVHVSLPESP